MEQMNKPRRQIRRKNTWTYIPSQSTYILGDIHCMICEKWKQRYHWLYIPKGYNIPMGAYISYTCCLFMRAYLLYGTPCLHTRTLKITTWHISFQRLLRKWGRHCYSVNFRLFFLEIASYSPIQTFRSSCYGYIIGFYGF